MAQNVVDPQAWLDQITKTRGVIQSAVVAVTNNQANLAAAVKAGVEADDSLDAADTARVKAIVDQAVADQAIDTAALETALAANPGAPTP